MPPADPSSTLLEVHHSERIRCQQESIRVERRQAWVGNVRFALAMVLAVLVLLAIIEKLPSITWLLAPVVGFLALSIISELLLRRSVQTKRSLAYHEHIVARMEDRWAGSGIPGNEYLPAEHPYAADLDIFGQGSLYERLCLCATQVGRETLASWLLAPADPGTVRERQEVIQELSERLDWRKRIFLLGSNVRAPIDTTTLAGWGRIPGESANRLRMLASILVGLSVLSVFGWILLWWPPLIVGLFLLLQGGFALIISSRVHKALAGLEKRSSDLFQLADLLTAVEREPFRSTLAQRWQKELLSEGLPPADALQQLARRIDLLDQTRNFIFAIVSALILWTTQVSLAIEEWRRRHGAALVRWLRIIGEMEGVSSLAAYAAENRLDPFAEIVEGSARLEAKDIRHPLLPSPQSVGNDVDLGATQRLLIVSGSNMSGKSTLLRAVGVNAVLAQMGAPVRARSMRMSPLAIGATLHIQDSLQKAQSRFYAEITRMRMIIGLTSGRLPVLFLFDEILHGTNSHDRKIGAEAIVRSLLTHETIGMITTHDLALTSLADDTTLKAMNVHFVDVLSNGELHFDYQLKNGPVRHGNALALMRAIGLEVNDSDPSVQRGD